jgi:hypothetical protein
LRQVEWDAVCEGVIAHRAKIPLKMVRGAEPSDVISQTVIVAMRADQPGSRFPRLWKVKERSAGRNRYARLKLLVPDKVRKRGDVL